MTQPICTSSLFKLIFSRFIISDPSLILTSLKKKGCSARSAPGRGRAAPSSGPPVRGFIAAALRYLRPRSPVFKPSAFRRPLPDTSFNAAGVRSWLSPEGYLCRKAEETSRKIKTTGLLFLLCLSDHCLYFPLSCFFLHEKMSRQRRSSGVTVKLKIQPQ